MKVELIELSEKDGADIYELLQSFNENENGFVNPGFGLTIDQFPHFIESKMKESKGIDLREGYVPQTLYWLYVDGKPMGIGKIRDYLTESLKLRGGHIGYGIRSEERGKGYGKILLKALLEMAKEKGIIKALLTCDFNNIGSRKVIEFNNGQLQDEMDGECKYWIDLK